MADIFIMMNTTFYDSDGDEIESKKRIRQNYLSGFFSIDLLSSIPFDIMFPGSLLRLINILKIIRIKKLTSIINKLNVDEEKKSYLRICQLVFNLILAMHCVGCLWNYVC